MEVWQEALKVALVGTERQAPAFTPTEEPVGRLLAALNGEEHERVLLRAGGLLTAYRRAGYLPALAEATLPASADPEEKPPVPGLALQDLMVMLGGDYREALPEWLQAVTDRGWRMPEEHLVELLEFGRGHPEYRTFLLPLLGKRGRWLAAQNPDWKYALQFSLFEIETGLQTEEGGGSDPEQIWQTGTKEERIALLHRLRRTEPTQARALVESTWKQDAPAERAEFVGSFATGLSMDDEPFLENALDDKRKEVRVAAQDLLVRLPNARLVQRMWERLQPLVQLQQTETAPSAQASGGLWERIRSLVTPKPGPTVVETITVDLSGVPDEPDKATLRDGIEAKSPYSNIGAKAWRLIQMLQRIPLSVWAEKWERSPVEIVTANRSGDWEKHLLEAWTTVLRRDRDLQWAPVLFASWIEKLPAKMPSYPIWQELLPPEVFEEGILHLLARHGEQIEYGSTAFTLLSQHKIVWSTALTRALMDRLQGRTGNAYYLASMMGGYMPSIPDAFRAEFFALWSKLAENNNYMQSLIDRGLALDAFRNEMRRKLNAAAQEN